MHAMEELADFAANHEQGALPGDAKEAISMLITDLLGATAAGLHMPLASSARAAASVLYGSGSAQIWYTDSKLSAAGAAMANAAAAS